MRLTIPFTDDRELEELNEVLASGYLTQGSKVAKFERKVAQHVGSKYAFAMSSCTTSLHLSLVVLDIGPGDEVLVSDFTFPASANVVVQVGAKPILVDIELDTFTMDVDDLQSKITDHTKAIMPVHAFGCAADMDPIIKLAAEYGIPVVEDAATALGTKYYDRFCGAIGTLGCFSFHPRKVITTGEGGMIITDNEHLAERIRLLRSHGGVKNGYWYRYEAAGYNYRLSDLQGAIGIAQMEKLQMIIDRRKKLARQLKDLLKDIEKIGIPTDPPWGGHIYQSFVIILNEELDRDLIIHNLRTKGIEATIGTYAVHDQPFYQRKYGYISGQLPNSHFAFHNTITIPLYPQMNDAEVNLLANELRALIAK
jgi:dTDP-4-amino-4,6-dideoxygalactose transaminase